MITIIKGKDKIKCSYKTYDEQFKQLGYVPLSEVEKKVEEPILTTDSEEDKISTKYGLKKKSTSKKEE